MKTSGLLILARLRMQTTWNAMRALGSHSNLKILVISVMATAIWAFLFFGFYDGFSYLNREVIMDFKAALVGVIFGVFFLSLLMLLLFSNGIIAYGSLFSAFETRYLFTQPLSAWHVYLYKLTETLLFSSWAFLFLGLPLIIAYGVSEGAPWYFYPGALIFFVAFALVPAALGGIFTLLIGRYFTHARRRVLILFGAIFLLILGIWFAGLADVMQRGFRGHGEAWIQGVLSKLRVTANPLLPSTWAAEGLLGLAAGDFRMATYRLWLLLTNGLFLGMIGAHLARKVYPAAYHRVQAQGRRRSRRRQRLVYRLIERGLFGVSPQMRMLIVKDAKTFLRDPVQWSQVLIFFGLLAVYFLNIRSFRYDTRSDFWNNFISIMNLTAMSLTLSTFTCRFIFPLLSLEGRKFWVLGLLPLERRKLLYSKFWFAFCGAFLLSEGLMLISDLMLAVSLHVALMHSLTVLMLCAGLSGLAVGMGAIYPDLQADNPAKIVSGFGGTLNLVLSLLFVVVIIALAGMPYHVGYMTERFLGFAVFGGNAVPAGLLIAAGVAAAATYVPLTLGRRAFERMEA